MTGRALSEEAMLASLRDIDLPAQAAGGLPADIAMTVGLAGAAALLVAGLLRLFSRQHRPVPVTTLRDRIDAARILPEADRRVALLHLLRDRAPNRYRQVAHDLYRPDASLPVEQLEAELERLV